MKLITQLLAITPADGKIVTAVMKGVNSDQNA